MECNGSLFKSPTLISYSVKNIKVKQRSGICFVLGFFLGGGVNGGYFFISVISLMRFSFSKKKRIC